MVRRKGVVTAVGTLALAVGIGFFMQSSETAKDRYGERSTPEVKEVHPIHGASLFPDVRDIRLTSASVSPVVPGKAMVADHLVTRISVSEDKTEWHVPLCAINGTAEPQQGGLVKVSFHAPCKPFARMTVHHNGMMFSERTDAEGRMTTSVPALADPAVVVMSLADGGGAVVQTEVEDLKNYGRTVLQWRGDVGFQLHAREANAAHGDDGHVWIGSPHSISETLAETRGFIVRLGRDSLPVPMLAEVFTYPIKSAQTLDEIDLTVETEVHLRNCGLDIEAQTIERKLDWVRTQDIILAIPDCNAVGNILVLNNLLSDVKVASR